MNNADFSVFWGIVVPGAIFMVAFILTVWLYRAFSKDSGTGEE